MQTDPSNTSDYGFVPESHDDARLALRGSHHARRFGRNGPSFGKSLVFDLAWVYDRHVGPCGGRAASAIAAPLMARARPMHLRAEPLRWWAGARIPRSHFFRVAREGLVISDDPRRSPA